MQFLHQCPVKYFVSSSSHQRSLIPRLFVQPFMSAVLSIFYHSSCVPRIFLKKPSPVFQLSTYSLHVHSKAPSGSAFQCSWLSLEYWLQKHNTLVCAGTTFQPASARTMSASAEKLLFANTMASASSRKRLTGSHPITICIEGNIGCGKTTLLNQLAVRPDVEVMQEPVHKWRNVRGKNLLDLMYSDPVRWSYLFQAYVQLTMMQLHLKPSPAKVKILERSIHSARHCFVENLFQTGRMSEPEYNVYCEWYSTITNNLDIPVDLIVYLSASPSLSQQRIKERGRAEEAQIPLSYLTELHELHRDWLDSDTLPAPLLVLPSDLTLDQMRKCVEERIDLLLQQRTERDVPAVGYPPGSPAFSGISPLNSPSKRPASLMPASASN